MRNIIFFSVIFSGAILLPVKQVREYFWSKIATRSVKIAMRISSYLLGFKRTLLNNACEFSKRAVLEPIKRERSLYFDVVTRLE